MIPGQVSKVLSVVSNITGSPDRQENLRKINEVLQLLYRDPNLMWLYFKAEGCAPVRHFVEPCRNCNLLFFNPTNFYGVVIPAGIHNITELRRDGYDIEITEERVNARCWWDPAFIRAEHLPPRLLERDPCGSRQVFFQSCGDNCAEDCGKLVGVEYLDLNGNHQREDIELSTSPAGTSVSVGRFISITFPERQGVMKVLSSEGTELGRYHPSILVPLHEWYRFNQACPGTLISYRGLREPVDLVFDTDMVPFSDSTLWRLGLRATQFMDSMELTPGQSNGLARIYAQLATVGVSDSDADKKNFNTLLFPVTSKNALTTARVFSGQRGPLPGNIPYSRPPW
jgi:hypothetical protein